MSSIQYLAAIFGMETTLELIVSGYWMSNRNHEKYYPNLPDAFVAVMTLHIARLIMQLIQTNEYVIEDD
jgi:hypothetical protein